VKAEKHIRDDAAIIRVYVSRDTGDQRVSLCSGGVCKTYLGNICYAHCWHGREIEPGPGTDAHSDTLHQNLVRDA